jgi:hypothetical protein
MLSDQTRLMINNNPYFKFNLKKNFYSFYSRTTGVCTACPSVPQNLYTPLNFVTNYFWPNNYNPYRCYAIWVGYFASSNATWANARSTCSNLLSGATTVIYIKNWLLNNFLNQLLLNSCIQTKMIIGSSYEMADAKLFAAQFGYPFWVN